jgi:hypothetical protein
MILSIFRKFKVRQIKFQENGANQNENHQHDLIETFLSRCAFIEGIMI